MSDSNVPSRTLFEYSVVDFMFIIGEQSCLQNIFLNSMDNFNYHLTTETTTFILNSLFIFHFEKKVFRLIPRNKKYFFCIYIGRLNHLHLYNDISYINVQIFVKTGELINTIVIGNQRHIVISFC